MLHRAGNPPGRHESPRNGAPAGSETSSSNAERAPPTQRLSVPTTRQVVPGVPVSIILKIDQPTGREVQGFVREVFTSGDHPRGIKVRLRDGRVGRVQRIVDHEMARLASEGLSNLGQNGEPGGARRSAGRRINSRHTDARLDQPEEPPASNSLDAYITAPRPQRKKHQKAASESLASYALTFSSATITCPICGKFEGDEAAVEHHVQEHFLEEQKPPGETSKLKQLKAKIEGHLGPSNHV